MSVNIYKKETDTLQKVAGNAEPINIWTGTSAEYEAEKDTIPDGSYVNITDDTDTYELNFPDGTGFYPDIKDGVRGYNTSESRGADTFHPFKGNIKTKTGTFNSISGTVTVDTSVKDIEYTDVMNFLLRGINLVQVQKDHHPVELLRLLESHQNLHPKNLNLQLL